jgi:ABC-2 type transport system permease protein
MYQSTTPTILKERNLNGSSKKISFFRVVTTSFKMNLQLYSRYKINLLSGMIEFGVLMAVFSIFAFALNFKNGYENLTQSDIMIFYLGAILLMTFNSTAIWAPINNINRDIYNGTLEYIFFSPSSKYGYLIGSIMADGAVKFSVLFLPALAILSMASGIFSHPDAIMGIFMVCMVILVNLMSLGILISLSAILWKQVNALAGILNTLFQFLAGAFFPITTFPEPVQWVAYLLPHTFGYDLIRFFSFQGNWKTIFPIEIEIFILIFFTLVYLLLSIVLLKKTEVFAKKTGLNRI